MSILNARVEPARALIAVDTDTRTPGGLALGHSCKLFPLYGIDAVIAHRGELRFFQTVLLTCQRPPALGMDFDALAAVMPQLLYGVYRALRVNECELSAAEREILDTQCVVLIGWSEERGEMVGMNYLRTPASEIFVAEEFRQMLSPAHHTLPPEVDFADCAALRYHMYRQCELIRREAPHGAGGGRFILVELERGRTVIEEIAARVDIDPCGVHSMQPKGAR